MRLPSPPLLLVTDRTQARRPLADVVRASIAGGCRWISVREKDLPDGEQIALVNELAPLVRGAGGSLLLHGAAELARACAADGVHLPAGADVAAVRTLLGPQKIVGISIHSAAESAALDPQIVDYVIAGPVFATESKPGYGPALGPAGVADIVRSARVPVIGIGGIAAANVDDVMKAGAAGIAVMGGVMRAADATREIRELISALDAADQPRPR